MNELSNKKFTELNVWKKSNELKCQMFQLIKTFPPDEKYRLNDQLIRASRSIAANIAEGHGRFTYKDQIHFCIQARGSLSEVHNHLIDSLDCNYIDETKLLQFVEIINEVEKLLNGYISYLRKQTDK